MYNKRVKTFYFVTVAAFIFIFAWVLCNVALNNPSNDFNPLFVIAGAAAVIALFRFIYVRINGLDAERLKRNEKKILAIYFGVLFITQTAVGFLLSIAPMWDLGAVFFGAKNLAVYGGLRDYAQYFQYFPNTWGNLLVLYIPFKLLAALGAGYDSYAYFAAGMLLNVILIDLSVVFLYLACKIRFGIKGSVFAIALVCFVPVVFVFKAPVFYSDTLSMFAPIAAYYLYLKQENSRRRLVCFILIGITAGIGYHIKGTPVLMLAAILIDMLFRINKANAKKTAVYATAALLSALAVIMTMKPVVYASGILDKSAVDRDAQTPSFFIMMGLQGNGGYNPSEYDFARAIADPAEREAAQRAKIIERLKAFKTKGLIEFFTNKSVYTWGDGTYETRDFLDYDPLFPNFLHKFLLASGEYYGLFAFVCQCIHMAFMALVVCCLYYGVKNRDASALPVVYAFIAVFAFFLFYETKARVFMNFYPVIIALAADGAMKLKTLKTLKTLKQLIDRSKTTEIRGN